MTGAWGLPMQAELGGVRYAIRSDYRDVLELLRWLNGQADPALDQSERWYVAMRLFYPEFAALPQPLWPDATQFLTEFLAAGRREQPRPGPALMDWQQDAPLIAAGISKAAGQDVRTLPYLHWWSFLAWLMPSARGALRRWWPSVISCAAASGWKTGSWTITAPTAPWWSCGAWRAQRNRRRKGGCWNCWGDEKCRR